MSGYQDLKVTIVGAGMGGLAAALAFAKKGFRQVHVYEDAPAFGFVGAGIQMAPNMIRILDRLGVWTDSAIRDQGTQVNELCVYEGATEKLLIQVPMTNMGERYGYSHFVGHRASLADGIYNGARAEPSVKFHFGESLQHVQSYGPEQVKFVIRRQDGKTYTVETDILIGADGIKSTVRESMLGSLDLSAEVEETGTAAYRILLNRQQLEPYPELLEMVDSNTVRRWIGENRHMIAYPIHNHTIFNVATAQPDVNFAGPTNATWTNLGDKTAMKKVFADFGPKVQQLLDLVPEGDVVEWRLRSHKPLDTWTRGAVALLGDACHPTLPHLSQGAAMAIEDAATLAEVLSLLPGGGRDREAIARALKVYELLRKPRTSTLVDLAAQSARALHLGAGQAKEERDRQFAVAKTAGAPIPDKWASPEVQDMIYQHDCIEDTHQRFQELYRVVSGDLVAKLSAPTGRRLFSVLLAEKHHSKYDPSSWGIMSLLGVKDKGALEEKSSWIASRRSGS
ncbi:hypothetical protein F66182_10269 [Fusarium sp. NRRL 66182]|nr:hypothetical protein F66182_10269 [Fusarium sp. NRRL 66182]